MIIEELSWFRRIIKNEAPAIVLTVDTHCLFIAIFSRLFLNQTFSVIATIHNNLIRVIDFRIPGLLRKIVAGTTGYLLRSSDKVVCVSKELAESLAQHFKLKRKPVVIYYELSNQFISKGKIRHLEDNRNVILSVGRFTEQKDYLTIIRAYDRITEKLKEKFPLWLVGDGPIRGELENYVDRNHIKGVRFTGWVQNQTEVLEKAVLFVFASNWEGFGYTIIEAMSQGVPVVATLTPFGPKEILEGGKYGLLVPMKNPQEMAAAVEKLLTDEKLYEHYSRMSLERAKFFREGKMTEAYRALLLDVCG